MQSNKFKGVIIYVLIILLLVIGLITILNNIVPKYGNGNISQFTGTYSELVDKFDNLEITQFELDLGSGNIIFKLKGNENMSYRYSVPSVNLFLNDTIDYREKYNSANSTKLKYNYLPVNDNTFLISFVPYLILIALMIGFTFVIMRQTTGGGKMTSFSRANTRNQPANGKKVTFNDVAGADEEKQELEEIVDFMKNPRKYQELGARIPKGVLLVGPPGTGKTLLAKAVAGEAGVPFFSISGSDFVEMFVGVGASRVRDLFDQAKKHTPSVVFIDEIDAVGRQRGAGLGGGHDEREQTLNQLLVEMDGFTENQNIIVMAATNRRDILDPALLRPGRFDRQIVVSYPDIKGREEILKVHTKNKKLSPDINLATIAKSTAGFTGADLENLVNEAALLAARKNRKAIVQEDIEEASIKVVTGPEKKSRVVTDAEKKLTAYHEGGHAVCTYFCPTQDKVHHVTIIPRGSAGGFTMSLPDHDKNYRSKTEMEESLVVLLGGRVAEKVVLDDISTGASNDIERATNIARSMVTRYGFSEKLGPIVYGTNDAEVFLGRDYSHGRNYSENIAGEIDAEIREIVETAYENARNILETHRDCLERVAQYLMKHEKMDGDMFELIMKNEYVEPEEKSEIDAAPAKPAEEKETTETVAAENPPEPDVTENPDK